MARATKQSGKRAPAKRATKTTRKTTTTRAPAKPTRKAAVKTATKTTAKATTKTTARRTSKTATKTARKTAPKVAPKPSAAKPAKPAKPAKRPASRTKGGAAFRRQQRELLSAERGNYLRQAEELKAEADALALEHEPGDVQFDEEGGEGGTANVDRELDLVLSAQARVAIAEIDRALAKLDNGTYGRCERCGNEIPPARLQAVPHAALCVACKSGGLASRR